VTHRINSDDENINSKEGSSPPKMSKRSAKNLAESSRDRVTKKASQKRDPAGMGC